MLARRGQATVEAIATAALVAAIVLACGAALVREGIAGRVGHALSAAIADDAPAGYEDARPQTQGLVLSALLGGAGAATVRDARILLARELGAASASRELARIARSALAARAVTALGLGDVRRGPLVVRITDGDDASRIAAVADGVRRGTLLRAAASAALGAFTVLAEKVAVPVVVLGAVRAWLEQEPVSGLPPGAEDGDVVACLPFDGTMSHLPPGARSALGVQGPYVSPAALARWPARGSGIVVFRAGFMIDRRWGPDGHCAT